jgi:signal transduction histidine kinase
VAFYSYLPPRDYKFQVIACNSEGVWNGAGETLTFKVVPHYWQRWWFLGLVAMGLLGAAGAAVRAVEKRKMQHRLELLERERAVEKERSRIAQDLHDDLGSSLTRISLLSGLAREEKDNASQVGHIAKISQSAAQTLRALEEIVWALRPGSDTLQSLVEYIAHFADELCEGDSLRCRLDLPADLPAFSLPPEMRHNIFLVVKESLTNALKHSRAREVHVQARMVGDDLEILVQDNGRGFAVERPGRGNGLGNMKKRAEAMGGTLTVESDSVHGTTIRLLVPLANGRNPAREERTRRTAAQR